MRWLLALALVVALPAAAQEHIYTGKALSVPARYGNGPGWYHLVVDHNGSKPVSFALTKEMLDAGLGDRLDPGSSADVYGDGVWIVGPTAGGRPTFAIEKRQRITRIHVDPIGQYQAIASHKAAQTREMPVHEWVNPACTVVGTIEYRFQAEGGLVWIGTHVDRSKPPNASADMAGAWPLRAGETHTFAGNSCIFAWTNEPGVKLHFLKIERGATFVREP